MFNNEIEFDIKTSKASCYFTKKTPLPGFETNCRVCSLGKGEAVGPTGPDNWSNIKLIVISEHPGYYEELYKFAQVPNSFVQKQKEYKKPRETLPQTMNGGELIRRAIENLFNISHTESVYYTNALKCNPAQLTNISKTKHINKCAQWWLSGEFYLLDKYAPDAPIIICGDKALTAIAYLYPSVKDYVKSWNLTNTRRRKDIRLGLNNRPVAVTFNPAMTAKGQSRIETVLKTNRYTGAIEVKSVKDWSPFLVGSPLWNFKKDIYWLKEFIN